MDAACLTCAVLRLGSAAASFATLRALAASPLLEFHTASFLKLRVLLMKGLGFLPLPASMSSISRPEAGGGGGCFLGEPFLGVALFLLIVVMLDEQPVVALALEFVVAHAHENPAALQPLAVEREFEVALAQRRLRVAFGLPIAAVPEHHCAAAILAFGDRALEI